MWMELFDLNCADIWLKRSAFGYSQIYGNAVIANPGSTEESFSQTNVVPSPETNMPLSIEMDRG
jgi:hypothetical protein